MAAELQGLVNKFKVEAWKSSSQYI
jgi:hypothetical protein